MNYQHGIRNVEHGMRNAFRVFQLFWMRFVIMYRFLIKKNYALKW